MFPNTTFCRKWSMTMYKNQKLPLGEMTFTKDFINDTRGDLYPILKKTEDCQESVFQNQYQIRWGSVTRLLGQFFPYASYEITAAPLLGKFGFIFYLTDASVSVLLQNDRICFHDGEKAESIAAPDWLSEDMTMIVSCRPGAFDIYFRQNGQPIYVHTFYSEEFAASHQQERFFAGKAALCVSGTVIIKSVSYYLDCGISQADIRPVRYENGDVLTENGKIWLTISIRLQEGMMQGVFSWIPGTSQLELTGALLFDSGDGLWCGDVATSLLYHREQKKWLLWVCSFAHDHILGHAAFEGDPRTGINVIDITLMEKAPANAPISVFAGMTGDEDPDFYYDEEMKKWYLAICRVDPAINAYRYVFFESEDPFEGYTCIGQGQDGAETGGLFVKIKGERYFVCGNSFDHVSDYRIYGKDGMINPGFDYPDGGFRGWGALMPISQGSRTRYYWLTFDRHNGSGWNWSYGNLYCFEAVI